MLTLRVAGEDVIDHGQNDQDGRAREQGFLPSREIVKAAGPRRIDARLLRGPMLNLPAYELLDEARRKAGRTLDRAGLA